MRKVILLIAAVFSLGSLAAQSTVVTDLSKPNESGHKVTVHQSDHITELVQASVEQPARGTTVDGFRLQIYSGNKGPKSRNRAYEIKSEIEGSSLNLDIYVLYAVPFWKVQVGNCLTRNEANELRQRFLEKFPEFASDAYVVPVKIQN